MEAVSEETPQKETPEEAPLEGLSQKRPGWKRSVAEGRFVTPPHWPKWKKRCGAAKKGGRTCMHWAVVGMPTCKFHGSGGEKNKQLGELRYLAWVITGGPQDFPVEHACRIALAVFAEHVLNNSNANPEQQMKAALWLTDALS